jgi:putative CocE/NonD family hydrolase
VKPAVFRKTLFPALLVAALVVAGPRLTQAQEHERVSRFGEYRGYSEPLYDGYARTSQYVAVRDGTRLAVDIFRPTLDGIVVEDPLPVIWTHHRYHRADVEPNGSLISLLDDVPLLQILIQHGYVIGAVDVRGGGASFGTRHGEFSREEAYDAYDITEWFAEQPWCTGNIGMFGISYLGITQYTAASTQPPHLKAIFPQMAMFDLYTFTYPGGILNENFVRNWGTGVMFLDRFSPAAPVDEDPSGELLAAAIAEHRGNWNVYQMAQNHPFRDSRGEPDDLLMFRDLSPSTYLDAINASGVAIYHLGGWYDMYPRDAVTWFNNLTVPQKIVMTPWEHEGSGGFDLLTEHLRWFDYWLKGIPNGIMDEPPIVYNVMGTTEWRTATEWPLPETQPTTFYFDAGPSGSVASVNDGWLRAGDAPQAGQDDYVADYSTTTGTATRWTNGYGGPFGYPDMIPQDEKSLTYTTAPLEADIEITGHPIVHLWVSSTAEDGDFCVYLEEVDTSGQSHYISEGVLRASHRALADPPWNYQGLPYHRSFASDLQPLPADEPVELVFDLQPTSNIFDAGHHIRIRVSAADADTLQNLTFDPPPTITVYRGTEYPSSVVLPVIPAD